MNFLKLLILVMTSSLFVGCASTPNPDGIIETSDYILDLGDESQTLVKEASDIEEDTESTQ